MDRCRSQSVGDLSVFRRQLREDRQSEWARAAALASGDRSRRHAGDADRRGVEAGPRLHARALQTTGGDLPEEAVRAAYCFSFWEADAVGASTTEPQNPI